MVRNKSLPIVSISDITVGYRTSLWRYMTKLSYMNKLYEIWLGGFEEVSKINVH